MSPPNYITKSQWINLWSVMRYHELINGQRKFDETCIIWGSHLTVDSLAPLGAGHLLHCVQENIYWEFFHVALYWCEISWVLCMSNRQKHLSKQMAATWHITSLFRWRLKLGLSKDTPQLIPMGELQDVYYISETKNDICITRISVLQSANVYGCNL